MKCRTCGNKMKKINGPGIDKPEYSCENCHDYRNSEGEWRSYEEELRGCKDEEVHNSDE